MTSELEYQLGHNPTPFDFFQAVRILERWLKDRKQVGQFVDPAEESVRFGVRTSISFPPSEIETVEFTPGGPVRMVVNFMGLTGPQGVLPYQYSLLVAERLRGRDRALRDFLDLFHHRSISLFYRAWEKHRFAVGYERDRQDRFTRHVAHLAGLDVEAPSGRPDEDSRRRALLFHTGLLLPQQRSALALEQMIEDTFEVSADIRQFIGDWYQLSLDLQCVVTDEDGVAGRLGQGAVVGDAIWDQQAKVRIRIGPLSRSRYDQFLPGGSAYTELQQLTRFFSGEGFEFELQLVLAREDVPACVLGADEGEGIPLAWGTWLRTTPFGRDADDTILTL